MILFYQKMKNFATVFFTSSQKIHQFGICAKKTDGKSVLFVYTVTEMFLFVKFIRRNMGLLDIFHIRITKLSGKFKMKKEILQFIWNYCKI